AGGETHTTLAPYTGEALATLPLSTVDDVAAAFEAAREARRQWAGTPVRERAGVLLRLHDLVLANRDEILDLIQWESGKARTHAFEECADVAVNARYYARRRRALLRPRRRAGVFPGLTEPWEVRRPKGGVGIISPWNSPFALGVSDALPALLAGNAVVSKPDAQTPLSLLYGVELARRAGLPEGVWQVVYGSGPEIGGAGGGRAGDVCFTRPPPAGGLGGPRAAGPPGGRSLGVGGREPQLVP